MVKKCQNSAGFLVRQPENHATVCSKLPEGGMPATFIINIPPLANLNLSLKLDPFSFVETGLRMNWNLAYHLQQRPEKED